MPNMVFELNGTFLVTIHRAVDPTVQEWDHYMETFRRMDHDKVRQIVFTDGGGPNTKQRAVVNEVLDGRTTLCAVVTPAATIRGIVTAFGWFNAKIKSFSPEETHLAFRHLGMVNSTEVEWAWKIVRRLREKLGDHSLRAIAAPPTV